MHIRSTCLALQISGLPMMRRMLVASILLTGGVLLGSDIATAAQGPRRSPPGLEGFLRATMVSRRIPGLQIAVVRRARIVYLGAYGLANIDDSVPVTDKTVFSINSATKAFTGVAIMQLVEQGKLSLGAPISRYLDGLPVAWQPVSIRQLLTHASAAPEVVVQPKGQGNGTLVGADGDDNAWAAVQTLPMEYPTGTKYTYNQTNYVLLGKIIEKAGGLPFTEFIRRYQFEVSGMPSASFGDSRDIVQHRATPYRYPHGRVTVVGSELGPLEHAFDEFPPMLRTAAGIDSTAEQIARWIVALQTGKVLKEHASLPTLGTQGSFNYGSPTPWRLALPTDWQPNHSTHTTIGARRSAFFVYPDEDLAIVILTNLTGANPEQFILAVAAPT